MSDSGRMSDEALVRLVANGDASALQSLYERHSQALYSLALRVMGDFQGAEEILQDTFFQLWRNSSQFDLERGSLIAWLLTITRHRAISRMRVQKNRVTDKSLFDDAVLLPQNIGPSSLDHQITRQLVSAAFAGLTEAQQKAVALAYFDGLTCEEIATRTQTPVGTVKTRLRSGLRTMKTILSNPIAPGAPDWQPQSMTLDDILITGQLLERVCRQRDPLEEMKALDLLAEALTNSPSRLLDVFLQMPLDLCHAGTGGISLLETDTRGERVFRWTNLSGALAKYVGGTTPRNFSPCGVTLDCNAPQLFKYPGRYFDYFNKVELPIVEGLVIPFHVGGKTEGTVWIVSHDEETRFDSEDARIMATVAEFAGCALHLQRCLDAAGQ